MVMVREKAGRIGLALCLGVSLAALATSQASAGAFLLREQSAAATGLSTAGAAAGGGGLQSAFWNGATITDYAGWQTAWSLTGIIPESRLTAKTGSTLLPASGLGVSSSTGDIAQDAVLPSGVMSYQLNDKFWLGLALNTPFGLTTQAPNQWDGSPLGITSKIVSYDINPSVAYKITDSFSVSAGIQALYFKTYLRSAIDLPGFTSPPFSSTFHDASVKGDSWGWGVTLGATWKPVDGTEIGVGYRSAIREKVKGNINFSERIFIPTAPALSPQPLPVGSYPARLNIVMPDIVTLGLKQKISPAFTLLAGFEWDHWNVDQDLAIYSPGAQPPAGTTYETIKARYKNGWLASLGGEYAWSSAFTLRAGIAYEKSPINNTNRQPILPDSDRVWLSGGFGRKISDKLTADLSYAHLFGKSGTIDQTNGVRLIADTKSHVDIVSVGLTYRFDDPPPRPAPGPLVRKY